MSRKVKWFKSAFSQETVKEEIDSKIPRRSNSFSNPIETISLVDDDNDDDDDNNNVNEGSSSTNESSSSLSKNVRKNATISQQQISTNWLDLFVPESINDLAVHPKKIAEVQDWLKHYENIKNKYPAQMLLISGPTGCGKTATIKVISKTMNYELVEWINPIDIELSSDCNLLSCTTENCSHKESQITIFKRFLFRSSRYKSLIDDNDRRLVLVEDFPNVILRDPNEFHSILSDYCTYGKSPLVFIAADSQARSLNIAHNLFPDHIKSQYNIADISFNSISTTSMKKVLKRISDKLKQDYGKNDTLKIPSDGVLDDINITANGDIRNAILNLQLISIKGGTTELRREKVKSQNNKRNNKCRKLSSIGRDETLTIMHALGRVMYPKYNPDNTLIHSPEDIADIFASDGRNFLNLSHANYLIHFKYIEDVVDAADSISLTDIIMNEYRGDNFNNIGLCLAIRGVMVSNKNGSGSWAPIKGVYKQNEKSTLDMKFEAYRMNKNITRNLFATDYNTYIKIINKT